MKEDKELSKIIVKIQNEHISTLSEVQQMKRKPTQGSNKNMIACMKWHSLPGQPQKERILKV